MKLVWVLVRTKLRQEIAVVSRVQALPGLRAVLPRVGGTLSDDEGDCFGPADLAMTGNGAEREKTALAPTSNDLLFPGYLFVAVPAEQDAQPALSAIKQIPGISRVVAPGKRPIIVPESWVEALGRSLKAGLPSPADAPSELMHVASLPNGTQRTMGLIALLSRHLLTYGPASSDIGISKIRTAGNASIEINTQSDTSRRSA